MRGISRLAENPLVSQEGLCSMELISKKEYINRLSKWSALCMTYLYSFIQNVLLLYCPTILPQTIASSIWNYLWLAAEGLLLSTFFFLSKNQLLLGLLQYSTTQRRNQDRKNGRAAGAPPPSITNGNLKKYRFCRHVDIKGFTWLTFIDFFFLQNYEQNY